MKGSDVVLAEVVRHGLQAVAEEMGAALLRTAHSVNIRDRRDFSCGVYTADGRLAAQAEHIPVHLGLLVGMVERVTERTGEAPPAGMTLVTNDPWISGSHLPDVVLVTPVDDGGRRVGYVANMAHQVDLGGLDPGSLSLGAREVFHEGLCLPPLALIRDGELDRRVVDVFRINSRTPEVIVGDLLAQAAANSAGARRLAELVRRTGRERFEAAVTTLRRATARRLAARIAELPRTPATFTDVLEWREGERDVDLAIRVTVTPHGDSITFDFTGTDDQVPGPVNASRLLTTSCVLYVLKAMLDPELASNAGLLDPVRIVTRRGTLVDAERPAAVGMCTSITSQRVCDALLGAFNQLRPEQAVAASTGSMNALIVGGVHPGPGTAFSYVETYGGGQGALRDLDGADGVHTHMTNTSNTPVETHRADLSAQGPALRPDRRQRRCRTIPRGTRPDPRDRARNAGDRDHPSRSHPAPAVGGGGRCARPRLLGGGHRGRQGAPAARQVHDHPSRGHGGRDSHRRWRRLGCAARACRPSGATRHAR